MGCAALPTNCCRGSGSLLLQSLGYKRWFSAAFLDCTCTRGKRGEIITWNQRGKRALPPKSPPKPPALGVYGRSRQLSSPVVPLREQRQCAQPGKSRAKNSGGTGRRRAGMRR